MKTVKVLAGILIFVLTFIILALLGWFSNPDAETNNPIFIMAAFVFGYLTYPLSHWFKNLKP